MRRAGGSNTIRGTSASEQIIGLGGADRLFGNGGQDCLPGGPGNDTLIGGPGNDTVFARDRVRDTIRCGGGVDSVTIDRTNVAIGCEVVVRR